CPTRTSRAISTSPSNTHSSSLSLTTPPPPSTLFPYTTLFRSSQTEDMKRQSKVFRARFKMLVEAQLDLLKSEDWDYLLEFEQNQDRKSTRLNSSHVSSSYAVFCLKKKTRRQFPPRGASM